MARLPDLERLHALVVVLQEGSITRAAARLHLTQQSLSVQVSTLEARYGPLLVRTSRGVRATDLGARLAKRAVPIIDAARDLENFVGAQTRLRVGFITEFGDGWISQLVRVFSRQHPDIEVDLRQFALDEPDCGLAEGEVDVAITEACALESGCSYQELWSDPRTVMISVDHPLASRETLTLDDLEALDLRWAVPPDTNNAYRRFWSAEAERVSAIRHPWIPHNTTEYAQAVAIGRAFGLSSQESSRPLQYLGIASVPIPELPPTSVGVATRARPSMDASLFCEDLQANAKGLALA